MKIFRNFCLNLIFCTLILLKVIGSENENVFLRSVRSMNDFETNHDSTQLQQLTDGINFDPVWERSMMIAPFAIQILGQLLLVAGVKDTSLKAFEPDRKFEYIKYPQSLRATLLQISNEGHRAFLNGHWAMNAIQLKMEQIPQQIRTILKLLAEDFPKSVFKRLLPKILKNIAETGRQCVSTTNSTKNEFYRTMLLIGEVVETTKSTESEHLERVEQNARELEILRQQQRDFVQEEKLRAQTYKEATESVRVAEQLYFSALKEIPTGFKALLFDLSRGFVKVLVDASRIGAALMLGRDEPLISKVSNVAQKLASPAGEPSKKDISFGFDHTLNMADKVSNSLKTFEQNLAHGQKEPKLVEAFTTVFRVTREFVQSLPENKIRGPVINLIKQAENLALNATKELKKVKLRSNLNHIWVNETKRICGELEQYQTAFKLRNPEENQEVLHEQNDSSKHEVLKAQITQKFLFEARRRQDEQMSDYFKLMETMRLNNAKIISIDLTTINYREIIEMLQEILGLLSKLEEQWRDMVRFFGTMFTYVQSMIQGPLNSFLDSAVEGSEMDRILRLRLISVLKGDVYGMHRTAHLLQVMSSTYFQVSSKYIMSRLSSLSSLITIRNDRERQNLMYKLNLDTEEAADQIRNLIISTKENFSKELKLKSAQVDKLIEKLGGPTDNNEKTIEAARKLLNESETEED